MPSSGTAKTRVLREDPARRVFAALARNPCSRCGRPLPGDQYCPQCHWPHCPICGEPHRPVMMSGGVPVHPCHHYLAIARGSLQNASFDAIMQSRLHLLIDPILPSHLFRSRHMSHLAQDALQAELGESGEPFIACLQGLRTLPPGGYTCLLLAPSPPPVFAWPYAGGAAVGFLSEDLPRAFSLVKDLDALLVEAVTRALQGGHDEYSYLGPFRPRAMATPEEPVSRGVGATSLQVGAAEDRHQGGNAEEDE